LLYPETKILTYDQCGLVEKGLKKFGFWNSKKRDTPADPKADLLKFRPIKDAKIDPNFQKEYRSKVGFLIHLAFKSRQRVKYSTRLLKLCYM